LIDAGDSDSYGKGATSHFPCKAYTFSSSNSLSSSFSAKKETQFIAHEAGPR